MGDAAVLTRRAVSRGSRAPGAGHLGHSIDELRRQAARAGSHGARARAGERGATGGRRAARGRSGINQSMRGVGAGASRARHIHVARTADGRAP